MKVAAIKIGYVLIGAIVLAALAGVGGFYGGMTFAQGQAQNSLADFARQRAVQNQPGANAQAGVNGANNPCGFGGQVFQLPSGAAPGNLPPGAQPVDPNAAGGQTGGGRRQGAGQFGGAFGGLGGAQLGDCVARGQIRRSTARWLKSAPQTAS
jgi:hypothetical protein